MTPVQQARSARLLALQKEVDQKILDLLQMRNSIEELTIELERTRSEIDRLLSADPPRTACGYDQPGALERIASRSSEKWRHGDDT